ncbi:MULTISPECIES: hypothetical protein [Methylocaldum]|uniref:hypothetical protein n=1 Tax=Methylocaldum sp. 14B TaxID=1912213 RepID=UPI00098ABDAC|nr:hypothetical protein [Methylocaldum sp. 14B]MVF20563.1 hypothetical protein [Methylocaldum sp. BRCS4]
MKRKPKLSTPMGRVIVDDAKVRKMAKHAGVWRALRDARRQGRTVIVVHGMVLFGAFQDGLAAFETSSPELFLEALLKVAMEAGCDHAEVHYTQRPDVH